MVDGFGAGAGEPFRGEEAIRVAGSGDVVLREFLGLWGGTRAEGLNVDFHAEGVGETCDLSANGAVSQDAPGYLISYMSMMGEQKEDRGEERRGEEGGEEEVLGRHTFEDQESRWLCH